MSFWQNLTKIGGIIVNFCLLTSVKIDFLPVNYTTVIWASQWCYQLLISFREVPSFNFIPYIDDKMLLQWYKPLPHRAGKQRFAKKNELVNMYIKRQHIIDKILEPRHIIFVQKKNARSLTFDMVLNSFLKEVRNF